MINKISINNSIPTQKMNSDLKEMGVAFIVGIFLYYVLFRPLARVTCLFDDPACVRLYKRQKGDAFLVDIPDSGETLWYNGQDLVAYNIPTGDVCKVGDPGYAWLKNERGFFCVKPLSAVREIFSDAPLRPWSKRIQGRNKKSATGLAMQLGASLSN
jgi:hypothetical protein